MPYSVRCLSLSLLALLACQDEAPRTVGAAALNTNPKTTPSSVPPAPVTSETPPETPIQRTPLDDRLASEASARPARAVRASALMQALSSQGVAVAPPRQVLASPIGADYCESTVSPSGLVLSLCEFENAASARIGLKRSRELFDRLVPNRVLLENGNVLLTLAGKDDAQARREAELARTAFLTLEPATL